MTCRPLRNRHRRGSALAMIVMMSVVISGMVLTIAYSAGLQAAQVTDYGSRDKAFFAAEGGLQWLYWEIKNGKITSSTTASGTISDCSYSCSCTKNADGSYTINSAGKMGIANASVTGVCQPLNTASLSVGGNLALALTSISGNVVVMGQITQGGASAILLASVNGKVSAANSISLLSANGSTSLKLLGIPLATASGGFYQNQSGLSKPSAMGMYNAQNSAHPATATTLNASLFSYDIANSYGGVMHLSGAVNISALTSFKGPGTLIVDGDLTGAIATFGTAAAPVNVIVKGNCTLVGGTIYGSLYIGGNYAPVLAGSLAVNGGSIVVDGNVTLGLLSSLAITNTPTPSFDLENFNRT